MGEEIKRLRELPGIMEIEAKCQIASYFDAWNIRDTLDEIDRVSISLFSLSDVDMDYDDWDWEEDENPPSKADWDTLLSNTMKPYSVTRPFWEALGWDITDGNACELDCAHYFAKQIMISESGWIEGIQFTPDGSGSEQVYDDWEPTEEELAGRLEREAAAFLLRRR